MNRYESWFNQVYEALGAMNKKIDTIENMEKTLNGLADEISEIKQTLGLPPNRRGGKRHVADIERHVQRIIRQHPSLGLKQVFNKIICFLAANDNVRPWHEAGYVYIEADGRPKERDVWEAEKFEQWKGFIDGALKDAAEHKNKMLNDGQKSSQEEAPQTRHANV